MLRKIVSVVGLVIVVGALLTQNVPGIMQAGMLLLCVGFITAFFFSK